MPGPYDGAEVLVWVNMQEPTVASITSGTTTAGIVVTANNAGVLGNNIRLTINALAGATTSVAVSFSGSNIDIVVSPATGATAASVVAAINASPAAKYYVTASSLTTGAGTIVAAAQTALAGGADASGTNFMPVSRQQGVDYDDTMDTIDAVSKGDRFALQLAGRQSGSFELSGLHSYEDKTQERVRRAYQRRELLLFRRVYPGTVGADPVTGAATAIVHEASCRVTGFSISHPDSDVATFSAPVSLQENWRVV